MLTRRAFLARAAVGSAAALAGSTALATAADAALAVSAADAAGATKPIAVTVYKSPTCGCCRKWVEHLQQDKALAVTTRDVEDMNAIKAQLGVPGALASCHTAVAGRYVFEGHVPRDLVAKVLRQQPKIAGLAVPGMPVGSPGMEMGARKDAYDVLAFTRQGKTSVYAKR